MKPEFHHMPASVQANEVRVLSCDPGSTGGLAFFAPGECPRVWSLPRDPEKLLEIAYDTDPEVVVIEKVHAGPRMAAPRAFEFGGSFHTLCTMAAVVAPRQSTILVPPASWQVHFRLVRPSDHMPTHQYLRKAVRRTAERLFPRIAATEKTADALLMGLYAIESHIPRHRDFLVLRQHRSPA